MYGNFCTLAPQMCALKAANVVREWAVGKGAGSHKPQANDTLLYTWRAAMQVYGYQPERALQIIDSAQIVGNLSEVWADANRARVYCMTQMNEQIDSLLGGSKGAGLEKGKAICEYIREVVMRDELFLDPTLNRQKLTERFSLPKERACHVDAVWIC